MLGSRIPEAEIVIAMVHIVLSRSLAKIVLVLVLFLWCLLLSYQLHWHLIHIEYEVWIMVRSNKS